MAMVLMRDGNSISIREWAEAAGGSVRAIELGVRSVPAVFVGDTRVQAPTPAKIKAAMRRKG